MLRSLGNLRPRAVGTFAGRKVDEAFQVDAIVPRQRLAHGLHEASLRLPQRLLLLLRLRHGARIIIIISSSSSSSSSGNSKRLRLIAAQPHIQARQAATIAATIATIAHRHPHKVRRTIRLEAEEEARAPAADDEAAVAVQVILARGAAAREHAGHQPGGK